VAPALGKGTLVSKTQVADRSSEQSHQLRRDVGLIGLLFASVGSIIGSGWLFGAMNAAITAGPAAMLSWAIGMMMILLIALTYSELSTAFPVSGGLVRFPHVTFGSFASFMSGWILWIACATVAPIEVEGALQYATKYADFTKEHCVSACSSSAPETVHTLTALGYISAVVLMALFVAINYIGVAWFARVNTVIVWWKLAIISLVVIAFVVTQFHASNFTSQEFMPFGWRGVATAIATSGIVFSYLGFRQAIELAGETTNPRKYVPIAVIGSVVICGIIYVALQVAFIGALDPSDFSQGWGTLSFENDFGPLAAISSALGMAWLAGLLYADAIVSPADTGLIYTTVTSRVSYATARNGNAPEALARTNRHGVPMVSLVLAFLVGLIVFLPFPSWQQLVGFITSATVLSFAPGAAVVAALRRTKPDLRAPFRCPGGDVIPLLAFISSDLIVIWSTWTVNWKLFVTVLIGIALLAVMHLVRRDTPPLHLRSGSWVITWLGGLAILSYLAGDLDDASKMGFWTSAIITVAFSVAIFYLAIALRLGPEETERHMEAIRVEAEEEDETLGTAH
jgi:amino acid transporter